MENLLPLEDQAKVKKEFVIRAAVTLLSIFAAIEIIATLFLIPAYLVARSKADFAQSKQSAVLLAHPEDEEVFNTLRRIQLRIRALVPKNQVSFGGGLTTLLSHRPPAITIQSLKFQPLNETDFDFKIEGRASTRQDLLLFSQTLQKQSSVLKVDIPVSNFAQDKNISFSATIEMKDITK